MKEKTMSGKIRTCLLGALAFSLPFFQGARAEDVFEIPVVLPLTGGAAFLGQGERDSLKIQETVANKQGGINGTPIRYVFHDDQSSPQIAVQLANEIVARRPAAVLGSALVAMCNAMTPVFAGAGEGSVMYCFSPGIHPAPGSRAFTAFISTHDSAAALMSYYRGRGFTRIAMITSTDASGQDGGRGFMDALKLPENKNLQMVASEKFAPADVSVSAQIEHIKTANPQALIVWTSGSPFGTVLKSIAQSGLDVPVGTTDANMTFAQMKQYEAFLPKEALFMSSEWPEHTTEFKLDPAVEAAQRVMFDGYKAVNAPIDITVAHAWDPAMLLLEGYRKLGIKATPEQMRSFIADKKDWAGINGTYDFHKTPQRGLDVGDVVVTRWKPDQNKWSIVSKPGGDPL
jgi:branched-chain amino acid transport system substrate-binding protein